MKKTIGNATLYLRDCRKLDLGFVPDALVSDPPYGINHNTDYTRFSKGSGQPKKYDKIEGDSDTFADRVPTGTVLVWCKRRNSKLGVFCSDCELAWYNCGSGCYESERNDPVQHPTQKPVLLMRWCIQRLNLPKGSIIYDPYMGSGATGLAALDLGYRFIVLSEGNHEIFSFVEEFDPLSGIITPAL